jgi:hypothetical protein
MNAAAIGTAVQPEKELAAVHFDFEPGVVHF